jgi:hypothetical protein
MLQASATSPARVLLAEILTVSGRKAEAASEWGAALATPPSDFEPIRYAVRRDVQAGQIDAAEKRLQRAADRFDTRAFRGGRDQEMCKVSALELQSLFGAKLVSRSARHELERFATAVDPDVRVRAVLELARVAVETESALGRARLLLEREVERGSDHALLLARLAAIEWLSFRDTGAAALARMAWDNLTWDDDPVEALETCVLVGLTCQSLARLADAAAEQLIRSGWRLRGRSGRTYLTRAGIQCPVVEAAFEALVRGDDINEAIGAESGPV